MSILQTINRKVCHYTNLNKKNNARQRNQSPTGINDLNIFS